MTTHPFSWLQLMSFSAKVIALRKARGLTQQGLADLTGIHIQQIKRYEAGTSEPSADALRKIATSLHVTTDSLLFEDGERGPNEEFRLQFEALSELPPEEQSVVKEVLESLIIKYQARRWDSARAAASKKADSTKRQASTHRQ